MKLNTPLLIASGIAGLAAGILLAILYPELQASLPQWLMIGIMFAIIALVVVATVFITGRVTGQSDEVFLFLEGLPALIIALVVALAVLVAAAMGLERVYDMEQKTILATPTSYIFLLDESGSMLGSDPNEERYTAVNTVMNALPADTPYAVYMFGSTAACARPMSPYSQGSFTVDPAVVSQVGGTTNVKEGLTLILDDHKNGKFASGGAHPRVILLSDGQASDMSQGDPILNKYRNAGISISTVGLGYFQDDLLEHIANKTHGSHVSISNAQDLAQGFTSAAAITDSSRDLFSERDAVDSELLYAILRVLFLTVLGTIIAAMRAVAYTKEDSGWLILIVGAIAAFVGALVIELLALFGGPLALGVVLYSLLVALTPAKVPEIRGAYTNQQCYTNNY